jgi:hypothetical protein
MSYWGGIYFGGGMAMARRFGLLVALSTFALMPGDVQARGYGRSGGMVNTPWGTANTNSPEWRMAGGNIFVYQQLMEEKAMMLQQQQFLKMQQQYMQQMQKLAKQQKNAPQTQAPTVPQNVTTLAPKRKRKRKKGLASTTATAKKTANTTATTQSESKP